MEDEEMTAAVLHYIYDPLCGWCYAAEPIVEAAQEVLPVVMHGGGMVTGDHRRQISPEFRDYILMHVERIKAFSGQTFSPAYTDDFLGNNGEVMDSTPPTQAILAAQALNEGGLAMLKRLQIAQYIEGQKIYDRTVIDAIAAELGYEAQAFAQAYEQQAGEVVEQHYTKTHELMNFVNARGFPTLVLQKGQNLYTVNMSQYLGKPAEFKAFLQAEIA